MVEENKSNEKIPEEMKVQIRCFMRYGYEHALTQVIDILSKENISIEESINEVLDLMISVGKNSVNREKLLNILEQEKSI